MPLDVRELLFAGLARLGQHPRPAPEPLTPGPLERRGPTGRPPTWDRPRILLALHAFVLRTGHFPRRPDWKDARVLQIPAYDTVRKFFGSLPEAERVYWARFPREDP